MRVQSVMKELRQQLVSALLVIITVAAVVAAAINLQQQNKFHLPDDGVTWLDQSQGDGQNSAVVAVYVAPGSPGEKAGVHKGDRLVSIADLTIERSLDVTAVLARLGSWKKVEYKILHNGIEVPSNVIIGEAERDSTIFYQYAVGAVYLAIGLFVYFRRGSAPRALHFFLLCLSSLRPVHLPLLRQAEQLRQNHLPGQSGGGFSGAHPVPAFLFRVSRSRQRWIRRRGAARSALPAGTCAARRSTSASCSAGCAPPRRCSKSAGCWIACGWASCARMYLAGAAVLDVPVAPRRRSCRPPSINLAAQWRSGGHRALRR